MLQARRASRARHKIGIWYLVFGIWYLVFGIEYYLQDPRISG
jgi:hypothetical protein